MNKLATLGTDLGKKLIGQDSVELDIFSSSSFNTGFRQQKEVGN